MGVSTSVQLFSGITLLMISFGPEDLLNHWVCSMFPSSGRSAWCYKGTQDLRSKIGLQESTEGLHEWMSLIFKFRPEAAHPAQFFLTSYCLFNQKDFQTTGGNCLHGWVYILPEVLFGRMTFIISILVPLPLLQAAFLGLLAVPKSCANFPFHNTPGI